MGPAEEEPRETWERTPPWTGGALRRLSQAIRDGQQLAPGDLTYREVTVWYTGLARSIQEALRGAALGEVSGVGSPVQITSRAKTIETLGDKLRRTPISLGGVQDVAGIRVEADMTLEAQTVLTGLVAAVVDQPLDRVRDLRKAPHSGYRAVHLWGRVPAGRFEVQVRTALQGAWANAYEALGDLAGRGIRYSDEPAGPWARDVERMLDLSRRVAHLEESTVRLVASERRALADLRTMENTFRRVRRQR